MRPQLAGLSGRWTQLVCSEENTTLPSLQGSRGDSLSDREPTSPGPSWSTTHDNIPHPQHNQQPVRGFTSDALGCLERCPSPPHGPSNLQAWGICPSPGTVKGSTGESVVDLLIAAQCLQTQRILLVIGGTFPTIRQLLERGAYSGVHPGYTSMALKQLLPSVQLS